MEKLQSLEKSPVILCFTCPTCGPCDTSPQLGSPSLASHWSRLKCQLTSLPQMTRTARPWEQGLSFYVQKSENKRPASCSCYEQSQTERLASPPPQSKCSTASATPGVKVNGLLQKWPTGAPSMESPYFRLKSGHKRSLLEIRLLTIISEGWGVSKQHILFPEQ